MRRFSFWALIAVSVVLIVIGIVWLSQSAPPTTTNTPSALPTAGNDEAPRISVQELHAQLQGENPPLVWEFRSPESYAQAHVPGSQLLTLDDIETAAQGLDKAQPVVTLCA